MDKLSQLQNYAASKQMKIRLFLDGDIVHVQKFSYQYRSFMIYSDAGIVSLAQPDIFAQLDRIAA